MDYPKYQINFMPESYYGYCGTCLLYVSIKLFLVYSIQYERYSRCDENRQNGKV